MYHLDTGLFKSECKIDSLLYENIDHKCVYKELEISDQRPIVQL